MRRAVAERLVTAHVITPSAPLERLLRDTPFEEVVECLARLVPLATRLGLSRPGWLPVLLVEEEEHGRFGLCLDNPTQREFGASSLNRAMEGLSKSLPDTLVVTLGLVRDMAGAAYAAQPTFRLRTEHWRWLAHLLMSSIEGVIRSQDGEPSEMPATPIMGRVWRGGHRNPLRGFADSQSVSDLLAFARQVVRGPDPLHLRLAFVQHLRALRSVRNGRGRGWRELDMLLGELRSEVVGEYHLDGQAAVNVICQAEWLEEVESLDL